MKKTIGQKTKEEEEKLAKSKIKDQYGITDLLSKSRGLDRKSAFAFSPFYENSVLNVEQTNKTIFILLKNGTLFYWSDNKDSNRKKILESKINSGIPVSVKCPTAIVDIVCGKEHCLAKGSNNKVYSWGSNSYGQLGLSGFPMNPNSEKLEPTEITALNNIRITKVHAINATSYAISEDMNLFGWGSNENGKLGKFDKNDMTKKYPTPFEIFTGLRPVTDYTLFLDKKATKVYFAELLKPQRSLNETLELNQNKHLYSKEHELKDELEKYKVLKNQIRQVKTSVEDYEVLIKDIKNLIIKFEDKINTLELKNKREFSGETNADQINFFDTQIQFLTDREKLMEDSVKKVEGQLDKNKIKIKTSNTNYNQENEEKNKTPNDKIAEANSQTNCFTNDRLVRVGEIISRVNTELQFQKHVMLNDHLKYVDETKKKEDKVKKLKDNIKTFEKAIEVTNKKIQNLSSKNATSEIEIATNKIEQEMPNFFMNSLKNINKINVDSDSLVKNIGKAMINMEDLEEKVGNLTIDKRNSFIIKINDMFHKNIMLSKENNILMEKAVSFSKGLYTNLLERIILNDNPPNFNELKEKIESFKLSSKEREGEDSDKEEDLKGVQSDESFNY